MRVLITGGTGFIGARLAVMARDAGHEVRLTGLVNTPAEAERKRALEGRDLRCAGGRSDILPYVLT